MSTTTAIEWTEILCTSCRLRKTRDASTSVTFSEPLSILAIEA